MHSLQNILQHKINTKN